MGLNNKGQSLVMFILIIPILLLVMVMVIDIGNVMYYKRSVDNINKIVIDYGLDNIDSDTVVKDMIELGSANNEDIEFNVRFYDMEFYVSSTYYVEGIFSNIMNIEGYSVVSQYKGYIDDSKNIIKKIK